MAAKKGKKEVEEEIVKEKKAPKAEVEKDPLAEAHTRRGDAIYSTKIVSSSGFIKRCLMNQTLHQNPGVC